MLDQRAWCATDDLPAGQDCHSAGHRILTTRRPSELELLKGRILIVINDALHSQNQYHYEDALRNIRELVR